MCFISSLLLMLKKGCSYFLGHAPLHHWGRDHPGSPSAFLGPSLPAEIKKKPQIRFVKRYLGTEMKNVKHADLISSKQEYLILYHVVSLILMVISEWRDIEQYIFSFKQYLDITISYDI